MSSMPAHGQPSSAAISPRSCPTAVGGRPICACGAKLYRNRKQCVPCALGWTEKAPETHTERVARVRAAALARQQAEDMKRIEALKSSRQARIRALAEATRAENARQATAERRNAPEQPAKAKHAENLGRILRRRDKQDRIDRDARLAAIRAAATARQRAAKGIA